MSSKFVEITDFDEAMKYSEAGLLVAKGAIGYVSASWLPQDVWFWATRINTYGILVEEDEDNSDG